MTKKSTKKNQVKGELIYGINPVVEFLKAKKRRLVQLYTTKPTPKSYKRIEECLPNSGVQIQYVDRSVLTKMVGTTDHQGVVAWVQPFPYRSKPFNPDKQPFLVLLDGIQDIKNLGAILRSSYCTGADGVILVTRHAAPLNAAAMKASAGLAEHLQIYRAPSVMPVVQELNKSGYSLYLAGFKGTDATQQSYDGPVCIVVGSEGAGITPQLYSHGTTVTLAQKTSEISYNASVAAGILLFLVGTKRKSIG